MLSMRSHVRDNVFAHRRSHYYVKAILSIERGVEFVTKDIVHSVIVLLGVSHARPLAVGQNY